MTSDLDAEELLSTMVRAAKAAGLVIEQAYEGAEQAFVTKSGRCCLPTAVILSG